MVDAAGNPRSGRRAGEKALPPSAKTIKSSLIGWLGTRGVRQLTSDS
jgi:hypothetical protein